MDSIGVSKEDFDKVRKFLLENKDKLCYICWNICDNDDYKSDLWIGDEQYNCCNSEQCKEKCKKLDSLSLSLGVSK